MPNRMVTQAIGGIWEDREIHPHVQEIELLPGATYLLCSDGLSDMVDAPEIHDAVSDGLMSSVEKLFEQAMAAGGTDNVSLVIVRCVDRVPIRPANTPGKS